MSITLHTNLGDLKLELFCELTPKAAKNFLGLAASGFYNGTLFHRNISGFMVQGGAPKESKNGKGSKCIFKDKEYFEDEIVDALRFDRRGVVAMANKGPNTNGSQFFITYKEQSHLNDSSTIFGKVIDGWETLSDMEKTPVDRKNRPSDPIMIEKVTIHANPIAAKQTNH